MVRASDLTVDEVRAVFSKVFNSAEGKLVLQLLEDFAAVNDGNLIRDLKQMVYMQGRRSVVLKIREILNSESTENVE